MSHLDDHVRAWLRTAAGLPGGRLAREGDVLWARTGIEWPLFNGGTGSDPAAMAAALEDLTTHGRPFLWWGAEDREDVLRAAGLVALDRDMSWEEAPRASMPAVVLPPGIRIEEVRDEADHRTWARTLREIHGFDAGGEHAWLEPGRMAGWGGLPWRMWTAFDDNEPVGVTLLFCGGGVASLIGVGVTEDRRRRGIGRALTVLPLHDAKEATAGLFCTSSGAALFRSLGFRPQGRTTRWLWAPQTRFTLRPGTSGALRTS
jgi:ribosomal protein S18 acetylase RimI-like enzyme